MTPNETLVLFLSCLLTSLVQPCRGQNVGVETTPIFKGSSCDASQERIIRQAWLDGVLLANAAFDSSGERLSITRGNNKIINFDTQAAIEYWGPPSKNLGYRQHVSITAYIYHFHVRLTKSR